MGSKQQLRQRRALACTALTSPPAATFCSHARWIASCAALGVPGGVEAGSSRSSPAARSAGWKLPRQSVTA